MLERLGLSAAMPPPEVHAMAHGPQAAGGDPWLADAVVHAAAETGYTIPDGGTVLDFGCSSGRVLRAIAAARDDVRCLGCDPNRPAIEWAQKHLPMAEFFVSPQRPPLDLAYGELDFVYAVSIWSHFNRAPALDWLAEMHRLIRPDGRLVLTTHGLTSIAKTRSVDELSEGSATEATAELVRSGFHFIDVFGDEGDWGVRDPEWGNAYFTLDWLSEHMTPGWSIRLFRPGGLDGNQDLIVLGREDL
ncbi:bifunctional 2-polyprenyl-6-hydroxyphenol methylase/3-demethylubiquinol 3-O-methyltransferase UbiG [Conexibacter sp. W3-3-2]|uniref:class I SAM-dependent methyltransferase n=1 Tax=Conexibacter sp. W3-3-2 TaxID=2675227 RepID=UPI0018AA7B5E|nr:class I SAM-dependent methyltransferase [Conexibacter sp. W3-3-2]